MEPYIISVSRREDIPAHRSEWFSKRVKEGGVRLVNNFSGMVYDVLFKKTKLAVFWTKNPRPMMKYLDDLPFKYYFQYTLNDYPEYEPNVPPLIERIKTFQELSEKIGKEKVIWRFDPIIVDDNISVVDVLRRIQGIGDQIHPYTEKLVFSFIDPYKKLGYEFKEIPDDKKILIAKGILKLNEKWGLKLATCAEVINLDGIEHNKCIDPELIERICGKQRWLTGSKDKSQRLECGCIKSNDIGTFKTCQFKCRYCYAQ